MQPHLVELFATLDPLTCRASSEELRAALERCDIDADDVAQYVRFSSRTYHRGLVRSNDWYAAWVMCWRNGQRSAIHDHKGSTCAVRVLRGTLTETLFSFAPNGHVKPAFSRDLLPGAVLGSEDLDLHQVSNLQADDADLITLHVYSPPLVYMGTYDLTSSRRGQEAMMVEFSDAAGI